MTARVIGAGLSGLVSAACLCDAGYTVEVVDAAAGPGGLIETIRAPEGLVERAANGFVWDAGVARWFSRLGLTPQFASASSRRRYIFRDGRVHRWPLTAMETAATVARVSVTAMRRQLRPRFDETIAAFGHRVAGDAAVRWLLGPALQGIYAAPAACLSAEAILGRRRRSRIVTAAPAGGMGEFIGRLYESLRRRGVSFAFATTNDSVDRRVPTVICTNAPAAAELLTPHAPALASAIRAVEMTDMVTATAFYEPHPTDVRGFGVLFPREAGVAALGVLFNGVVFEGRSRYRLETWIYGAPSGSPGVPASTAVEKTIAADRLVLTGRADAPIACYTTRRSPALPIYDAGILSVGRNLDRLPPGLTLAGNYLGDIGVSRLIARAEGAAASLTSAGRSPS